MVRTCTCYTSGYSLLAFKQLYLVRERERQLLILVFAGLKNNFFYTLAALIMLFKAYCMGGSKCRALPLYAVKLTKSRAIFILPRM